jgi:hypothetical protein
VAHITITAELTGNGWIGEIVAYSAFGSGEFATKSSDVESLVEVIRERVGKMLAPPKVKAAAPVVPSPPPPALPNQPAPRKPRAERHSGTSSREEQFFGDDGGSTSSLRRK